MRVACIVVVVLMGLSRGIASAQIHIAVEPTRVLIGVEFVPRCVPGPGALIVQAGQTVTLPADSTLDCIEVAGILRASRTSNTVLRVITLLNLPMGVLDFGTEVDPMPCGVTVDLVVRNVPIDLTKDPFQWGHGLVNFGTQHRVGCTKTPTWTTTIGDVQVGSTTLTLAEIPTGWRVGDALLLPDTRRPWYISNVEAAELLPRREAPVTIAAISGAVVTLSKPLDFAHLAMRDPDGAIVARPPVANLTRNIVLRSESLASPGHTANVGHEASWDIRYNQLVGLGRTKPITLDSTTPDLTHIGTQQVGRYCDHDHHAKGFGSLSVGNVCLGHPGSKWGFVLHGTHDARIEGNIAVDFPGAGFVTEDGYEVRNVFTKNLVAYSIGNHGGNENKAEQNAQQGCPGCEGSGFWLRGVMNTLNGNVSINNAIGINLFNINQVVGLYPSLPGGVLNTPLNRVTAVPPLFRDNATLANVSTGLEYWGMSRFPVMRQLSAFNGSSQFIQLVSSPADLYFVDSVFVGSNGTSLCLQSPMAYATSLEMGGGRVVGCRVGLADGGAQELVKITGTTFQNIIDVDYSSMPRITQHEGVIHKVMSGRPAQFMIVGPPDVWNGQLPLPDAQGGRWIPQRGSLHTVKSHQGVEGQDFRLFERQSLASLPSWPSIQFMESNPPEAGLTMGQSWAKYGIAYGGEAIADAEVVPLAGLANGRARAGLGITFGPPRGVVTYPTLRAPAVVESGTAILVHAILTGNPMGMSDLLLVSVDGEPVWTVGQSEYQRPDERKFGTLKVSAGVHTIRTWRSATDTPLQAIPTTLMTFSYVVGVVPPNEVCGDKTDNNGDGQIDEGCVVIPPPPPPPLAACADKVDNDKDGLIDLADPGCANAADTDEANAPPPPPPTLVLTCPIVPTVTAAGPVTVTYPLPITTGGTPPVSVVGKPASGSVFAVGMTPVTVTATSADKQTKTCTFSVTVTLTAPIFTPWTPTFKKDASGQKFICDGATCWPVP